MTWLVKRPWLYGFKYLAGDPRHGPNFGYAKTQRGAQKFPSLADAKAAIAAHPAAPYKPTIVKLRERPRCPTCNRAMPDKSEESP